MSAGVKPNTAWARRKRAALLAERNRFEDYCQKRRGGGGVCGGELQYISAPGGGIVLRCPACARQRMGVCRDCDKPVDGRRGYAIRCAQHKEVAKREQMRRSQELHREERLEKARASYQQNDEVRRRRNEYRRLYRKAHPDKIREQKRRAALRDNAAKKHTLAWHRKHNKKKARILRKRQQAKITYYREHPDRPTPKCAGCAKYLSWQPLPSGACGRPPKWCDRCCNKYELARRVKHGTSVTASDEPPLRAYVPSLRELESQYGTRTCVTDGCDVVVTHRKKKCSKCKAADAAEAVRLLEQHRGRGRRTDLERVA